MSKKKKLIIIVTMAVIVCLGVFYVWWLQELQIHGGGAPRYKADYTIDNTTSAWIITITNITLDGPWDPKINLSGRYIDCRVDVMAGTLTNISLSEISWGDIGFLQDIKGNQSRYGVTWNDNDNDSMLSVGDNITISKTGGPDGKYVAGEKLTLLHYIIGNTIMSVILP